jgi:predicted nucleic acid-binding protein
LELLPASPGQGEAVAPRLDLDRRCTCIDLGDYLLAGTCVVAGLELATLSVKHFPMLPDLAPPFPSPTG